MKVTKGNISKVLIKASVSKSVISRGRVCSGVTEGFEYIQESESFVSIGYAKRSSSYSSHEIWFPRKQAALKSIAEALAGAGFKVELKEFSVEVSK